MVGGGERRGRVVRNKTDKHALAPLALARLSDRFTYYVIKSPLLRPLTPPLWPRLDISRPFNIPLKLNGDNAALTQQHLDFFIIHVRTPHTRQQFTLPALSHVVPPTYKATAEQDILPPVSVVSSTDSLPTVTYPTHFRFLPVYLKIIP